MSNQAIIVLGIHRSWMSALAGILASSGFQVDDIDYFREIPDSSVDVVCLSATLKSGRLAQAGRALHAFWVQGRGGTCHRFNSPGQKISTV